MVSTRLGSGTVMAPYLAGELNRVLRQLALLVGHEVTALVELKIL